jgi:murein DD-endopeptidase MepM/ murein hydrolase activator NlpD/endonuclease/exonuclease/phosphatase family metal-dependent hydrolase
VSLGKTLAAVVLLLALPVLIGGYVVVSMMATLLADTTTDAPATGCAVPLPGVAAAAASQTSLSDTQLRNAATIIGVGRQLGVPPRGWVVAIATARQEATMLNLASYANPGSLVHRHDGVAAGDHDSVGIFQQRDAWGPLADRMSVATSARMFFTGGQAGQPGLLDIPGWQRLSVAAAAQAVQVSAFPSAYAQWETLAAETVTALAGIATPSAVVCAASGSGTWGWPVPDGFGITARFGECSSLWSSCHTGTDFDTAAGVPVSAAAAGVVTSVGWGGAYGNLIQITHPSGVQTWYAHLSATSVQAGDQVQAGTVIGAVGATGNTTGAHLHLEVRVDDRPVDPLAWLQQRVGQDQPAEPAGAGGSGLFTIATFNLLGHSHTEPGGKAPGMASGPTRTRWAARLLNQHGVDVVGLQEFQPPQHEAFTATAGATFAVFPGPGPHNAIAWRRATFELVDTDRVAIPYFNGQPVGMPLVRLRHRSSGQEVIVINVHNPADTRSHPRQGRWRAIAKRREIRLAHRLHDRHGLPVFVVGDMNETASYFCAMTRRGPMISAAGGHHQAGCSPPQPTLIDQIYGTAPAEFSGYTVDRSTLGRVSDHPLVFARVW